MLNVNVRNRSVQRGEERRGRSGGGKGNRDRDRDRAMAIISNMTALTEDLKTLALKRY